MLLIIQHLKSYLISFNSVIAQLGGCVVITLKWNIVILNEVKNLIESMPYKTEILRLKPQNDIATQPLDRAIQKKELDYPVKPDNDNHWNRVRYE
jgi:hypothetical protein